MYLSRLILDPRGREVQRCLADCHRMHRAVMEGFQHASTPAARDALGVLHRLETPRAGPPRLLVQSGAAPDWTRLATGFLLDTGGEPPNPHSRPLDPLLDRVAHGGRFRFRLAANPTRKIDTKTGPGGVRRNGRRVDLRREDDRRAWLERQAGRNGFALEGFSVSGGWGTTHGDQRVIDGPRRELSIAVVTFEGVLRVTDPQALRRAVVKGIGSGKAFGCGLLSLAPLSGPTP